MSDYFCAFNCATPARIIKLQFSKFLYVFEKFFLCSRKILLFFVLHSRCSLFTSETSEINFNQHRFSSFEWIKKKNLNFFLRKFLMKMKNFHTLKRRESWKEKIMKTLAYSKRYSFCPGSNLKDNKEHQKLFFAKIVR